MIDNPLLLFAVLPLAAYVIGSTPFGVIIARFHKVDLRSKGSGNVGATNVGRVLGKKWGFLCFFLDVGKGIGPVLAAGLLVRDGAGGIPTGAQQASLLMVAFGAIAGHVFSFYLKFRGGKGVATSLGVVLGVFPYFTYPGLCAFAIWIVVTVTSRYVSLGSIVAAVAFVAIFAAMNFSDLGRLWPLGAFAAVMAALIIFRHRANIARLLAGTENKIGSKRGKRGIETKVEDVSK